MYCILEREREREKRREREREGRKRRGREGKREDSLSRHCLSFLMPLYTQKREKEKRREKERENEREREHVGPCLWSYYYFSGVRVVFWYRHRNTQLR